MEPGEMLTSEEAERRANECISAPGTTRAALALAIITAWYEGAQYGAKETSRLTIAAIDNAFERTKAPLL